jgi:hypothetical protein
MAALREIFLQAHVWTQKNPGKKGDLAGVSKYPVLSGPGGG